MLNDEIGPANGAQQPQEPNTQTSAKSLVRQQQSGEDKQESAREKQYPNDTPKPIFPSRMYRRIAGWWSQPISPERKLLRAPDGGCQYRHSCYCVFPMERL